VTPQSPTLFYDASSPFVIATGAGRVVIGPLDHYGTALDSRTVDGGALGKLTVDFRDGVVTVTGNGGARQAVFEFNATPAVRDALRAPGQAPGFRPALVLARTSGNLGVSVALVHVAAREDGNRLAYARLGFFLLAGE
jgi:hypothetical protein